MNADDTQYIITEILSGNLYTYCANNPIMYVDYNGKYTDPIHTGHDSIIHLAESLTLKAYEYVMSITMYSIAKINTDKNAFYDFSNIDIFKNKITQSEKYQSAINGKLKSVNLQSILEHMVHEHRDYTYIGYIGINFDNSDDLNLSLGHCNASIHIYLGPTYKFDDKGCRIRKCKLQVRITDYYDFKLEKHWSDAVNVINDLFGYIPQTTRMLTPYHVYILIEYQCDFICKHGY